MTMKPEDWKVGDWYVDRDGTRYRCVDVDLNAPAGGQIIFRLEDGGPIARGVDGRGLFGNSQDIIARAGTPAEPDRLEALEKRITALEEKRGEGERVVYVNVYREADGEIWFSDTYGSRAVADEKAGGNPRRISCVCIRVPLTPNVWDE